MSELSEKDPRMMTLIGHLNDARKSFLRILIAMVLTTLISFAAAQTFVTLLAVPIGGLQNLQSIEVTENIGVFMRVALLSGFILATPVILLEILRFILPGLEKNESRWIYLLLPLALIFFVGGVVFAYLVMLPKAIPFLIEFGGVKTNPRLSSYFEFVTGLLFWVGVSFEAPLLMFFLAKLHVVSARALAKQWRIAVVVIAVLAAVVTPTPDPVNMALLMAPFLLLYLLGILFAALAK